MAYLFLVTGALLILIAGLPALRILLAGEESFPATAMDGFDSRHSREQIPGDGEQLAGRLAALQAEVTALTTRLEEVTAGSRAGEAFRSYLAAALAEEPRARNSALAGEEMARAAVAAGGSPVTVDHGHRRKPGTSGQVPGVAAATSTAGAPAGPAGDGTAAAGLAVDLSRGTAPEPEELSFQERIRLAHAAGESIDSLARRFGRGKGEIALILNLRR